MNICYINPTKVLRRPIVEIANRLANQGNKISIVFPHDKKNPLRGFHFQRLLNNKNIKLYPINSFNISSLRYAIPNPFQLFGTIKSVMKENDVVHIWEYYYPLSVIPLLLRKSKAKIVLTTDGYLGYSYKPGLLLTVLFKVYTSIFGRFLFNRPDRLTTYGYSIKKFAKKAKVPLDKLSVISTGIDLDKFKPGIKNNIRKELGIAGDTVIVLFIGMLTERKGVPYVIKLSDKLYQKYNIKTLIVGSGPFEKRFKRLAKNSDSIMFLGQRRDIPQLLNACDILFLPSMGEGLPGVVMEASACSKPSIATNEGATPDIMNENTGILVNPYDGKGYRRALESLVKSRKLRERLGNNALEHIKNFSWDKVVPKYEKLYLELIK